MKTRRQAKRTRASTRKSGRASVSNLVCKTRAASNKYQIGTSGFMVSQSQWLGFKCLNCIEINGTFYRLPSPATVEKWRAFPPHMGIVIKASKYITHIKRLKDVKESLENSLGCHKASRRPAPLCAISNCLLHSLLSQRIYSESGT